MRFIASRARSTLQECFILEIMIDSAVRNCECPGKVWRGVRFLGSSLPDDRPKTPPSFVARCGNKDLRHLTMATPNTNFSFFLVTRVCAHIAPPGPVTFTLTTFESEAILHRFKTGISTIHLDIIDSNNLTSRLYHVVCGATQSYTVRRNPIIHVEYAG